MLPIIFSCMFYCDCVNSQIDMMDYDLIGRDDLIGGTVIDLEDRWFDTRWQVRNKNEMSAGSQAISASSISTII